jgi:hypothetical protein
MGFIIVESGSLISDQTNQIKKYSTCRVFLLSRDVVPIVIGVSVDGDGRSWCTEGGVDLDDDATWECGRMKALSGQRSNGNPSSSSGDASSSSWPPASASRLKYVWFCLRSTATGPLPLPSFHPSGVARNALRR